MNNFICSTKTLTPKKKRRRRKCFCFIIIFSLSTLFVTIRREKKYIEINGDHVDKPGMIFPVSVKYKLFVLNNRTPRYFQRYF